MIRRSVFFSLVVLAMIGTAHAASSTSAGVLPPPVPAGASRSDSPVSDPSGALHDDGGHDDPAHGLAAQASLSTHEALLAAQRRQRQTLFLVRARRDAELNRLALARLAASRGGDPDFNEHKNRAWLAQMRQLKADYDRQLENVQAELATLNARLAASSAVARGADGGH